MIALTIFLILFLISASPLIAVLLWLWAIRFPLKPVGYVYALFGGALAFLLAGVLQSFFPSLRSGTLGLTVLQIFIQIAFTEEAAKVIILLLILMIMNKSHAWTEKANAAQNASGYPSNPVLAATYGATLGLVVGLSFALIENAGYGASDFSVAGMRALTAAPIHGACGSRAGSGAALLRERPFLASLRFFSAVAIHGFYNLLLNMPGFPAFLVFPLVIATLLSSILTIYRGIHTDFKS